MGFFDYFQVTRAQRFFLKWYDWAIRVDCRRSCGLARTLRSRLATLLN